MAQIGSTTSVVGTPVITAATTPISTPSSCLHFLKKICDIKFILKTIAMICTGYIGYKIGEKIYEWFSNPNQKEDNQKDCPRVNIERSEKTPQTDAAPLEETTSSLTIQAQEDVNHQGSNIYGDPASKNLRLLMIGKTGAGKSATGNSIFEKNVFQENCDTNSSSNGTQIASQMVGDRGITIVDTPGISDTRMDDDTFSKVKTALGMTENPATAENPATEYNNMPFMKPIMQDLLRIGFDSAHCQEGFDAIVLVRALGTRMSQEDVDSINDYKKVLGSNALEKHGVVVITGGDSFKMRTRGKKTFDQWCDEQKAFNEKIFGESEHRCILFNNVTEDDKILKEQQKQLIDAVDKLKFENGQYVKTDLERVMKPVNESQEKIMIDEIYITFTQISQAIRKWETSKNKEIARDLITVINEQRNKAQSIQYNQNTKEKILCQLSTFQNDINSKLNKPSGIFSFFSSLFEWK